MVRKTIVITVFLVCLLAIFFYRTYEASPAPLLEGSFGGVSLRLDLARTPAERAQGLGDREDIPQDYGMLFVFPNEDRYGFWMKDTLVPLDIFWLNPEGKVVSYYEDVLPETYPHVFYPSTAARYVLETRAGFGKAHGVATGTPLILQTWPSVSE